MISEKDRAVVASMVRTGMALDVLKKSFPKIDEKIVEEIYNEENEQMSGESEEITISMNCS